MNRKLWVITLALFLLLYAVLALTNVRFAAETILMGVLAAVAGVLALLDR